MGEPVVVEGRVDMVVCSPQACLVSFEPGFSGLVVAVRPADAARLPDPKRTFEARRVRVRGVVEERNGRPRIELSSPEAIELAEETPVAAASRAGAVAPSGGPGVADPRVRIEVAPSPQPLTAGEAAARLGLATGGSPSGEGGGAPIEAQGGAPIGAAGEIRLLRHDLAALVARLAALEERLAALDARVGAIEESVDALPLGGGGAAVQMPPPYVVPGTNPPTLHRVTRGWSAERVLRVLGEPAAVSGSAPGPFTWHYGGGRALTIDERGLVVSTSGF